MLLVFMTVGFVSSILISTRVWDPRPMWDRFVDNLTKLSEPRPDWTKRADNKPDVVAVIGSRVIVAGEGFVSAYAALDGSKSWDIQAFWGTPAGDVVVARERPDDLDAHRDADIGYKVYDPSSRAVLWSSPDAIAVWTYSDQIIDLSCSPNNGPCRLRFRSHRTGTPIGPDVALPSEAKTVRGLNPALAQLRDPAEWFDMAERGVAEDAPPVFALPLNGRIFVVDTFNHVLVNPVSPPDRDTRISSSGDHLLYVKAERVPSGCRYSVDVNNYRTGKLDWRGEGFDLDTARGAGCEQREDPLGATNRLVVNGSDNRPMLVEVDRYGVDHKAIWTGLPGAKILAVDRGLTVILAADGHTVSVIDFDKVGQPTLWTGTTGLNPQAALSDNFVIIRDLDAGKIFVLRRGTTAMKIDKTLVSKYDVFGVGANGIVLGNVRTFGYVAVPR